MDQQQQRQIGEAAEQFADAVKASYQAVAERGESAQELNAELAQELFNSVINNLRTHAEANREMTQELISQQERQREAARALTQESATAYMDFIHSLFFYHRNGRLPSYDRVGSPRPEATSDDPLLGEETEPPEVHRKHKRLPEEPPDKHKGGESPDEEASGDPRT